MITKRTDELKPGDMILRYRIYRTVSAVIPPANGDDGWDITLEPPGWPGVMRQRRGDEEWTVRESSDAPSPLDLAVARAQELADQFDGDGVNAREISELFDLFRAAR